jgi:hypothetical protein
MKMKMAHTVEASESSREKRRKFPACAQLNIKPPPDFDLKKKKADEGHKNQR